MIALACVSSACGRIGYDPLDARQGVMQDSAVVEDGPTRGELDATPDVEGDGRMPPPDTGMMGCPMGRTRCGSTPCVDLSRDNRHCGTCGFGCSPDSTCENGACVARTNAVAGAECTSSDECGRNPIASGFCLTTVGGWANGYCSFHCRTNADCQMGEACIVEPLAHVAPFSDATGVCLQRCLAPGMRAGCNTNATCAMRGADAVCVAGCEATAATCGGNACNVVTGQCTPCSGPGDCRGGGACNAGVCACTATTDCGLGSQCILATGRCGCANNLFCPDGMQCNTTTGECSRP